MRQPFASARRRAAQLLAATILILPGVALAQTLRREPIRIAYEASPGCPDAETFAARVIARSSRVRLAEHGEAARTFAVTLVEGTPATGELNVVDGENVESARRVTAETCADVAEAMSLIVALAANPTRREEAAAEPPRPPPPPRKETPHRRRHAARRPPRPAAKAVPPHPAVAPEPEPPPTSLLYAGADLALAGGVTPEALAGASPYFGWQSLEDGPISPEFRLSALRSRATLAASPAATASFVWTVGRLDGCPFALTRGPFRLTTCVRIEAGAMRVDTTAIRDPRGGLTGWFAAGPLVRAQQRVKGSLFADAELGALVRATQERYVVLPTSTFYTVPLVGLCAGVGMGALFP